MKTIRRCLIPLFALLPIVFGCAGLPVLKPLDPALKPAVLEDCRKPFLPEKYRLVHALEALLPDGRETAAIGVLVADPGERHFRTVLMTFEGWVLFDVESGEVPIVHRAVPPFDTPAFARRMAEDINLAFFRPGAVPVAWGQDGEGGRVCRYEIPEGRTVDVVRTPGGAVEIRLYGAGQELRKKVSIPSIWRGRGPAEEMEIRGGSPGRPTGLRLRLIESRAGHGLTAA